MNLLLGIILNALNYGKIFLAPSKLKYLNIFAAFILTGTTGESHVAEIRFFIFPERFIYSNYVFLIFQPQ